MPSTILIHPDKIFQVTDALPRPRPFSKSESLLPNQTSSISFEWKEAKGLDISHQGALFRLERALRPVHKRKVRWFVEETTFSELPPDVFLTTLLRPVVDIFYQLRSPHLLKRPMECISLTFGKYICGVTFIGLEEDFKKRGFSGKPIILALNDENLFPRNGQVSSQVGYALSKAMEYDPSVRFIIVTNFNDIVIFAPPSRKQQEAKFEKVLTDRPILALRVLAAAYLHSSLPSLINTPSPVTFHEDLILPEGPPQNPSQPLISDEELFMTHRRFSDFDYPTLIRDRDRALQCIRWLERVRQQYSKVVAHPGDILTSAKSNVEDIFFPEHPRPIYPYDPSEIPTDTAMHLKSIQRESPLVTYGIAESFDNSRTFALKITGIISGGSRRSICTVYQCQIASIDNKPVLSSPFLCLKLFDDRFLFLPTPDPDDDDDDDDEEIYKNIPWWFKRFRTAEWYALQEALAYDKLRPVHGSVVPWFYGMYKFTLPNGMTLYGLVMEYIEGHALNADFVQNMDTKRQIEMIKSVRHSVRVLDVADVSQLDWHRGQILTCHNPKTDEDYVVLVDFASATQTWSTDTPNFINNYLDAFQVLSSVNGDDEEFVMRHFGEPDVWDPIAVKVSINRDSPNEQRKVVRAKPSLFPYITSTFELELDRLPSQPFKLPFTPDVFFGYT